MVAAVNDIGAMLTQRAAQATARDQARSAVLGRFDAADARRQFSLDQADAARADQAARTTRSRTEQGRAASARAKTDERQALPKAESHEQAAKTPAAKDTARAPATRSETKRSAADEPAAKSVVKTAAPEKSEKPTTAADEAVPHEAEAPVANEVAVAGVAGMPQPGTPAPPAPMSSTAPSGPASVVASEGQQLEARETETAVSALGTKSAKAAGATPLSDTASQATSTSQAGPTESGAAFSAVLDTADPPAVPSTGTANVPAAKASASADAATSTSPTQAAAAPVPLGAVPMTIALRSLQNASQFEIRLDPLELGRIDVRLDIDKESGTVSADLVVDRPSTLALLQRDAGTLQQALSQAGLDASAGISLSLRDGRGGGQDRGDGTSRNPSGASRGAPSQTATDSTDPIPVRALRLSGLDIRI